jgi:uncharacterized RDD family membrane protein YckC
VRCGACGAVNKYQRRHCHGCGEPLSLRALIRLLFSPDPTSPGASPSGRPPELASPRLRLLAAGLDITLMVLALFSVGALGHDPAFASRGPTLRLAVRILAWVAVLAHPVLLEGASGQTFGKRLVGIRVVTQETGGPLGYRVAAHRAAARALFWPVSFLALTEPLLQTLPDRSAGTVVVHDPPPGGPRSPRTPGRIQYETTDDA